MKRLLLAIVLFAVFCGGLAISYYNSGLVRFDYLAGILEIPLVALLVLAFGLGLLVAALLNLATNWGLRREVRRLQRQVNATEVELRNLRHLSADADPAAKAPEAKPNA